jgi:hypothetical protein
MLVKMEKQVLQNGLVRIYIYKGKTNFMVGMMILKMKGNKISYLNEYWNQDNWLR